MKRLESWLLKAIFTLKGNMVPGIKPEPRTFSGIEIPPFKDNASASVSISADFEHNWAFRAWPQEIRNKKGLNERQNIPRIVQLLDEYSIPVTWAIVGHLFLESCERGANGHAHSNMPRPIENGRFCGDWYMHDPCTNFRKDPLWYAPDLIHQITASKVSHEIGTHTFSHFDFRRQYSSEELVQREIEECKRLMAPYGVQPKSLVFPHNECEYSYAKQLFNLGIVALRHRDSRVRLSYPERLSAGNYRIYESMNLRSTNRYEYLSKVKIFVEEAIRRQAAYHIFFHPSDPTRLFEDEFHQILKFLHAERERRRIWVTTMSELVAYCEARQKVMISIAKAKGQLDILMQSTVDNRKFGHPEISLLIPISSTPRKLLMERSGELIAIDPSQFSMNQQRQQLLVNVSASSKLVRLVL